VVKRGTNGDGSDRRGEIVHWAIKRIGKNDCGDRQRKGTEMLLKEIS
jgi:hypothetical protein